MWRWLFILIPLSLSAQGTLSIPKPPTPVTFDIYSGRTSRSYSSKTNVGYPSVGPSNYSATVVVPKGTNFFAVTAQDAHTGLESAYSGEINAVTSNSVTLVWNWSPAPYRPKPVIVTLSFGTNTYTMTNPASLVQLYRLRGLSSTSAVVVGAPNLKGLWVTLPGVPTFTYPPQKTPDLTITRQ